MEQVKLHCKLKVFNPEKFIIMRDQDSSDCIDVKEKLLNLCNSSGNTNVIVRIVCHELESWFLGDLKAVEKAFNLNNNELGKLQNKNKYRNPDKIINGKEELRKLIPYYLPNTHAGIIAQNLDLQNNKSVSFQVFIKTLQNL